LVPESATVEVACPLCGAKDGKRLGTFLFQEELLGLVECRECRLVYVSPRLSDKAMDVYFQTYTDVSSPEIIARWRANKQPNVEYDLHILKRLLPGGRILDVGCGYGFFLEQARSEGYQTMGTEISKMACEYANNTLGLDVRWGTLKELNLPATSFDVVTCIDVLYYCPAPLIDLREMYRILRPGGVIAVRVLTRIDYARAWQRITRSSAWDGNPFFEKEHIIHFSVGTMCRMLAAAGYEILRVYPSHLTYWKRYPAGVQVVRKLSDWVFQTLWRLSGGRVCLSPSTTFIGRKPAHAGETGRA